MFKVFSKIKVPMNSIHFGKGLIKSRSVYGSQAYRAQDSTYVNHLRLKTVLYRVSSDFILKIQD